MPEKQISTTTLIAITSFFLLFSILLEAIAVSCFLTANLMPNLEEDMQLKLRWVTSLLQPLVLLSLLAFLLSNKRRQYGLSQQAEGNLRKEEEQRSET